MATTPQPTIAQRPALSWAALRGSALPISLYILAAVLIGRAVVTQNYAGPPLKVYSHGLTAMPFRARYMMTPVLRWAETSPLLIRAAGTFRESSSGPQDLLMQFIEAICVLALGPIVVRLRNDFSPTRIFPWLSPWILLWVIACTYVVRYESRFYLPYDLISVVFFSIGLIACVEFRPFLLLFVLIAGTYNRETTIFLLPIWFACNFNRSRPKLFSAAGLALVAYILVKLQIRHWTGSTSSGLGLTLSVNARLMLFPHHWPQLASVAGYLALPLWFGRRLIHNTLLKRAWLGLIPLILVALLFGWWNETRIFGELTCLIAVTAAIEFEEYLIQHRLQPPPSQLQPTTAELAT
jgi:hypothetical protein